MNNKSVCFGAKNDSFGSFSVLHYGTVQVWIRHVRHKQLTVWQPLGM